MPLSWFKKRSKTSPATESSTTYNYQAESQIHGLFLISKVTEPWNDQGAIHDVDIIFVHGLHGHFRKTWLDQKTGYFWPADYLGTSLPGARIFTYGYPSGGLQYTRSEAGIRDFASELLDHLQVKRQHEKAQDRPIIFVSHSLGGIVVKQATFLAKSNPDYQSLWPAICGIIFLGTPHRGSLLADDGLLLAVILNSLGKVTGIANIKGSLNMSTLDLLKKDRRLLNEITSNFLNCLETRPEIKIVSFFETKRLPGLNQLVVNETSAQLGMLTERCIPMDADHREICRFSGPQDMRLERVGYRINKMIPKSSENSKHRSHHSTESLTTSIEGAMKECVPFLDTVDLSQYSDITRRMVNGTLQWLHHIPQFLEWYEPVQSSILWVSGFAGSGKTTLTAYVRHSLLEQNRKANIVAAFFCDDKDEKQRSGIYVLQNLIFQIVQQCKKLWHFVARAKARHGTIHFQRLDGLWQTLSQIICCSNRPTIAILLDAIDECEHGPGRFILERLCYLGEKELDVSFKVFVTSRLNASSLLQEQEKRLPVSAIWLDDHQAQIAEDISLVIRQTLHRFVAMGKCQANVQDLIANAMISKANNTFLWARFALSYLEERRGLFQSSVADIMSLMPGDLEDVYTRYLLSVPEDDAGLAAKILHYIIVCDRALTAKELSILITMDLQEDHQLPIAFESSFIDVRQIENLLGSLVRFEDDHVYLVHQTLKDYILKLKHQGLPLDRFVIDTTQRRLALTISCGAYIEMCLNFEGESDHSSPVSFETPHMQEISTTGDSLYGMDIFQQADIESIDVQRSPTYVARFELFDYAALHWYNDIKYVLQNRSDADTKLWDTAWNIYESDQKENHIWFRYLWLVRLPFERFPKNPTPLMKAAFLGHLTIIDKLISRGSIDKATIADALYWAVRNDHQDCVHALIAYKNSSVAAFLEDDEGVLLFTAAEHGSLRSLMALLQQNSPILRLRDRVDRTSVMLAAGHGQAATVEFLLQQPNIDLVHSDHLGRTALHWAIYSESLDTIRVLVKDERVDINITDQHGRTPLIEAAESGQINVVKLLLKQNTTTLNVQDRDGRTALSYACSRGHFSIVRRLCAEKGIDMLLWDKDGRNPHSWAASQKHTDVLQYICHTAPSGVDVPDGIGWAPLAWTLGPPAIGTNALFLLANANVDINRKDNLSGRSIIHWLASYGETDLLRAVLSNHRVVKDVKDNEGRTPLMEAAIAGRENVVQLLLDVNICDINAQDDHGRTALALAARGGRLQTVIMLARRPGVQLYLADKDGLTPADVALRCGQLEAHEYLR